MPQANRYDTLAALILTVSLVIMSALNFFTNTGVHGVHSKYFGYGTIVFVSVLLLLHYYFISKGYQWARILYIVLYALSILFLLLDYKKIMAKQFESSSQGFAFVLQWVLSVAPTYFVIMSMKIHHQLKRVKF